MHPEQAKRLDYLMGEILNELIAIRMELEHARIDRREMLESLEGGGEMK